MRELVVATRNQKKLRELKRYLRGVGARVSSTRDLDGAPHIREDGRTFKANAAKKALGLSRFTGGLALADDSGLAVDALGGRPGVRSSRFAGKGKSDRQNNLKVLRCMRGVAPKRRGARFVCAVAIADNGRVVKIVEEACEGRIGFEMRGHHGFGYDSLFLIPRYGKTFGELGPKVKDRMSHRSKALKKARAFLKRYL